MISDSSIIPFDYNINCLYIGSSDGGGGSRASAHSSKQWIWNNSIYTCEYIRWLCVSFKFLVWFRNSISRRKVTRHLHFQIENERKNQNSTANTHVYNIETGKRTRKDTRSDLINNNGFDIHHICHSVAVQLQASLIHSMADLFVGSHWQCTGTKCCVPPTLDN